MNAFYSDTRPEIEDLQARLLRQVPPWRKLEMMNQLIVAARQLAWQGLRTRFPLADDAELRRHYADLVLGEELARKVYGDLNDVT